MNFLFFSMQGQASFFKSHLGGNLFCHSVAPDYFIVYKYSIIHGFKPQYLTECTF